MAVWVKSFPLAFHCFGDFSFSEGGWPTRAYEYIRDQGVAEGVKYPYKGKQGKCMRMHQGLCPPVAKIPNACELSLKRNETDLMKIIGQYGPVVG
jgi:Papain family cysteine protease